MHLHHVRDDGARRRRAGHGVAVRRGDGVDGFAAVRVDEARAGLAAEHVRVIGVHGHPVVGGSAVAISVHATRRLHNVLLLRNALLPLQHTRRVALRAAKKGSDAQEKEKA